MPFLAKTDAPTLPGIIDSEPTLPRRPISYLPANRQKKLVEQKNITSTNQDIPINKWVMPAQPQGYLSARQHDIF